MLSIFKFLIISRFLSTISADTSLLFGDTDPLPYDLFSDDDLEFGEALFEEPPPELLSFDGCSSGDLGYGLTGDVEWTSKMRRRDACRSEIAPTTDDPDRTPPDTSGTQTVNGLNSLFQEYNIDTYMPPPEFQDLGCQSLWGKVFKYTVCGSGKRDDQSLSAELDVMITSFTVQNCQLLTLTNFICMQPKKTWCCPIYYEQGGVGVGVACVELYILQGRWKKPSWKN